MCLDFWSVVASALVTRHVDGQARNNGGKGALTRRTPTARALRCPLYFPKAKATRVQAPFSSSTPTLQHLWFCFSFESFACLSWCLSCFFLAVAWAKHTYSPTSVSHGSALLLLHTIITPNIWKQSYSLYLFLLFSSYPRRRNDGRRRRRGSTAQPSHVPAPPRESLPLSSTRTTLPI